MEISESNSRRIRRRRRLAAYTLVEVLVASGILVMGLAAACMLSLTMGAQEEMNHRIALGLSLQENAARLFQLGVSPAILPSDPNVVINVTTAQENKAGIGMMDTAVFQAAIKTSDDATRTSTLTVYRASVP